MPYFPSPASNSSASVTPNAFAKRIRVLRLGSRVPASSWFTKTRESPARLATSA